MSATGAVDVSVSGSASGSGGTIVVCDVDGTLTKPRNVCVRQLGFPRSSEIGESLNVRLTPLCEKKQVATPEMTAFLAQVRTHAKVAIVGGSDFTKIQEQMGKDILNRVDYLFSENGLMAYKNSELIAQQSIKNFLGEDKLKQFINFSLHYIADLDIPIKRGTFIEFRNGMLNVSPIGRNCTQQERDDFFAYDKIHHVREKMVQECRTRFGSFGLQFSIGGQISFDVFPTGWDKTYCLQFLEGKYDRILFFGDRTEPGGNDHEIAVSPKVHQSFTVTGPDHTITIMKELFHLA
ncbi:phosphomannomutase B [Pelomyxa schiedti]|nr:phosphomannomutase B [Pelomyxa schiedti]